jgi:hypothetical protein
MKVFVAAKPGARNAEIRKIDEEHFIVAVKEPPVRGLANRAIADALALFLNVVPSRVRLVSGFSSRKKLFEIL